AHRSARPVARSGDRPVLPAAWTERFRVAGAARGFGGAVARRACLGVLMRALAPQRAARSVPDLSAVANVQQAADLESLVAERRSHARGPLIIGILYDAQVGILHREAVGADEQRTLRSAATDRTQGVL